MAATATLNLKVSPEEKSKFASNCAELGTTPSNALRMFIAAFNRQGGFPFDVSNPYGFNADTMQAIEDTKARKGLSKSFKSVDAMFDDLKK